MKRQLLPLLILTLILFAAAVAVGACGGDLSSADRAMAEKIMKMWDTNDAAAAKQLFAEDATIFWPENTDPPVHGINDISSTIANYPLDPMLIGDTVYTFVPSDEDMKLLSASYKDSRFIAFPVALLHDAFLLWVEVKNGKVQNQWISYMYPFR